MIGDAVSAESGTFRRTVAPPATIINAAIGPLGMAALVNKAKEAQEFAGKPLRRYLDSRAGSRT
jgi:hypothetical protein